MSSSIRTRSRTAKGKLEADVVYQTDLTNAKKEKIRVISKKKVRADVQTFDRLKKKFDDIAPKPDEDVSRFSMATVVAVTHVNTFLYAACFFIQVGTLPVPCPDQPAPQGFLFFSFLNSFLIRSTCPRSLAPIQPRSANFRPPLPSHSLPADLCTDDLET